MKSKLWNFKGLYGIAEQLSISRHKSRGFTCARSYDRTYYPKLIFLPRLTNISIFTSHIHKAFTIIIMTSSNEKKMASKAERLSMSWHHLATKPFMMTSSNGHIFRFTGPSCGKFTGHRWILLTKASDAELWYTPKIDIITKKKRGKLIVSRIILYMIIKFWQTLSLSTGR